jgi:hypothetical protein
MQLVELLFIAAMELWLLMPLTYFLPKNFEFDVNLADSSKDLAGKASHD